MIFTLTVRLKYYIVFTVYYGIKHSFEGVFFLFILNVIRGYLNFLEDFLVCWVCCSTLPKYSMPWPLIYCMPWPPNPC